MALNPTFASASVNPSQSMGNDASVNPTQGALPTANQPQGDSFMGGNPFTQTGYAGVKPTGMGGFYAEETGFTPPQGYNQLGEFIGQQPQGNPSQQPSYPIGYDFTQPPKMADDSGWKPTIYPTQAPYNNGQLRYDSGADEPQTHPIVGNLGNDVEIPKLNYLGYKPGWQQEADNTWSYNTDNMSPHNQHEQDWNPQYIGYRGVTNDMYQDALNRGDFSGITDKYTSFTKPRYISFGNDKADYSQIGLSQTALDHLKMMSGAQDAGQFSYDTQTGMFNQSRGWGQNPRLGERQYTGMTDIPLDVMNKLGSGEEIDFSPYRRYTNGFNTEGQPNPPQIGDQPLPVQQPQVLGTQVPYEDPRALIGPTPPTPPAPTFLPTSPLTPTATPTGTKPMATNPLSTYATTPTTGSTPAPTLNATPGATSSGSFGQGGVLPNVTTTQQQVTAAPSFYTDYLNQLATQGGQASQNAQYVGAQPLQEQAFNQVSQNVGNYQPTLQNAINLAQNAGGMSAANVANPYIQGAALGSSLDVANPYIQSSALGSALNVANPYIQQAALGSSLDVANPYIQEAAQGSSLNAANPYLRAASQNAYSSVNNYMNPYVNEVVNQIGSLGQRQIQQSLAPQATAGLVGSGQFGSKRGAQALGQTISDANQNILSTQSQALNTGYQNAMQAAQADMARQLQAGSTAGQLSSADLARKLQAGTTAGQLSSTDLARLLQAGTTAGQLNTSDLARQLQAGATAGQLSTSDLARLLQSGATAGQLTSSDMQNRLATAGTLGNLAGSTQSLGLNDINALSTLGQQQQTIAQNEQLFPMQQLANQSALLRGYTIPTSVSASQTGPGQQGQFQTSPLQQIMSVGTLLGALAKPGVDGTSAGGNLVGGLGSLIKRLTGGTYTANPSTNTTTSTSVGDTSASMKTLPDGRPNPNYDAYADPNATDEDRMAQNLLNGGYDRSDPSNYDEI